MPYSEPVNTKILEFLNRAQTKIGLVSILIADKVSEDARYETYRDEVEIAYGLLSFVRSLDNNFNDWTELEIIQFIDKWNAKANLNSVPYFDHNPFNERLSFTPLNVTESDFNTRSVTVTSTATLTPDVSSYDLFVITAQSEALVIANPTGTAVLGNGFMVDIEDNGSARAITYGNLYTSTFVTLPTTTIAGKRMKMVFQFNGTNWELLNVINEQ